MLYFEYEQAHAYIWPYSAAWAVIGDKVHGCPQCGCTVHR